MALSTKFTIFAGLIVASVSFSYYVSLQEDQNLPVDFRLLQWLTVINNAVSKISVTCPLSPTSLLGTLKMPQHTEERDWMNISAELKMVNEGGRFKPLNCTSRHKVAIIIPYRNRARQLNILMFHLHPILMRQDLDYGIYLVEQADDNKFNRATLFNVGYAEASKEYDWDCYIFHDVDFLPEDDRNFYTCPEMPRHMSVAIDNSGYKLLGPEYFGGVSAMSEAHFRLVNGFSNQFWGWGGEDDDMWYRIAAKNLVVFRYPENIARYTVIWHERAEPSPDRWGLLTVSHKYYETDGLSNLRYTLRAKLRHHTFTNLTVQLHHVLPEEVGLTRLNGSVET